MSAGSDLAPEGERDPRRDVSGVVALLQDLVRIPSVNPDGDPGAAPEVAGEQACAEYVGRFLESLGAAVILEEVLPGRPNVIGRFPHADSAPEGKRDRRERESGGSVALPRLLLAPHTDTVGVTNMTIDPFGAEIREGRIFGRGSSDTKGTMAAMLWALREIREEIPALAAEVTFAGLMGEETGQPGSRHFAREHGGDFDFAVVGEPTSLNIVHTHKGCVWVRIATTGRAAHGSQPERGENAIIKMASLIRDLDTEFREKLAAYNDPVLGACTINIGTCHGGSRANIVADRCETVLDLRVTPSLRPGEALGLLDSFLRERDPGIEMEPLLECAPLATDPADPFIERLLAIEPPAVELAGAPWFCDGAVLAEGGIPAVALGPGSIDQAHTDDEFLAIEDLEAGVVFYRKFLESFRVA